MPRSARRRTTPPIPTIRSIRSLPLSSRPARMCSSRRGTAAPTAPMGGAAPATRAPAQLKGLLQRTARDIGGNGWDYDLGYGVIDAAAALQALGVKPLKKRAPA